MVAEGVAEEVKTEHRSGNRSGGKEHKMGRVKEMETRVIEHGSPAWSGGRNAEAEKGESGFSKDDTGHANGCLDEERLNDIGKDVAEEDAQRSGSQGAGCIDEFAIADRDDLSANEARVARPATDGKREHEVGKSWTEKCSEGDGKQNSGKSEESVHGDGGESRVDPAADVAGDAADDEAQRERGCDDGDGDSEGQARAIEQAGQCIAAEFVGSGKVRGGRSLQAMEEVDGGGVAGCEEWRGEAGDEKKREKHDADEGKGLTANEAGKCGRKTLGTKGHGQ